MKNSNYRIASGFFSEQKQSDVYILLYSNSNKNQ